MILEGRFANGDRLPSIRDLAAQEGLNPITVLRAYRGLAATGAVEMHHGRGIFVASDGCERLREFERARFLTEDWPAIRQHMERLQLDVPDMIAAIREPQAVGRRNRGTGGRLLL